MADLIIYTTDDGATKIDLKLENGTVWLSQLQIAELFQTTKQNISKHILAIYEDGELDEKATVNQQLTVQTEGDREVTRSIALYNLDVILAVGYRVNSAKADHSQANMGLTTWKHAPEGRILKSDVTAAKNYLSEKEIRRLERAVTGFFDYAEDLIEDEQAFTMQDFAQSVNEFLAFRRFQILEGKGQVSKKLADQKATAEYDIFNKTQKIESDFDKVLKALEKKGQDNE